MVNITQKILMLTAGTSGLAKTENAIMGTLNQAANQT